MTKLDMLDVVRDAAWALADDFERAPLEITRDAAWALADAIGRAPGGQICWDDVDGHSPSVAGTDHGGYARELWLCAGARLLCRGLGTDEAGYDADARFFIEVSVPAGNGDWDVFDEIPGM